MRGNPMSFNDTASAIFNWDAAIWLELDEAIR